MRERQARDRNRQLLRDFGHLETQLGLLCARTDAIRRRKVRQAQHPDILLSGLTAESPMRGESDSDRGQRPRRNRQVRTPSFRPMFSEGSGV